MSIELYPSGFYEWRDYVKHQPGLGVESKRIDECMAYYQQGGFRGLFGTPGFGFDQDNMDFLKQATNARWLHFWDISLKQIDALYELTELEHLSIHPKRPGIDFSRFPALKSVTNHWNKADTGFAGARFTTYYLWRYQPRSKSFEGLEMPPRVKELHLTWASPASLEGLPVMKHLKRLEIHRSRNMSDLSALPRIAPRLETLLATTSSKIQATAGVLDHPTLKLALIDGKGVVDKEGITANYA